MVNQIGRSTDPSTAEHRDDVAGNEVASFRYNNPGAQYPSARAARFGQTGYGIIGGGHKIARFPSPLNGAAANFDLLSRNYAGMQIGEAGTKWTGAYGFGVPGYSPDIVLTREMVDDPAQAIALLKAIAGRESGKGNNLTEEQWRQAHNMFKAGSADAYLDARPPEVEIEIPADGTPTGAGLLKRAREHIGEAYVNVQVPKDEADYHGPWDCAEFVSWLVYQEAKILYGCVDDNVPPAQADAYTGAWKRDLEKLGKRVSVEAAAATVGGIVLRYPPADGAMGHIALCDGKGSTVEAKGRRYGVIADTVHGRPWDTGILIPGITYGTAQSIKIDAPGNVYGVNAPNMDMAVVMRIQQALAAKDFDPGEIDGEYGLNTQAAVIRFQEAEGLVVDGEVGPETAAALGVSLVAEAAGAVVSPEEPARPALPIETRQLLALILAILSKEISVAANSSKSGQVVELLLPLLVQSALSGRQIDIGQLLNAIVAGKSIPTPSVDTVPAPVAPAPQSADDLSALVQQVAQLVKVIAQSQGSGTASPTQEGDQLRKILKIIQTIDKIKGGLAPLGQVNGAFGETIGKLLNGKKSAIGIIGVLATTLLSQVPAASGLGQVLALLTPAAGLSQFALPIFLAMGAWGVLGKLEKWAQGTAPPPKSPA